MGNFSHHDVVVLFVQLSVILAFSRLLGEVSRLFRQPAVVGEIFAGILLGPTVLGALAPDTFSLLFPIEGSSSAVLEGIVTMAVVLLLFIAGLEVDLHVVLQQGRKSLFVSFFSLVIPFAVGFLIATLLPSFFGVAEKDALVFALFIGTVMGMTALPVIARILMDLNIFRSSTGMLIVASAMIVDLLAWLIFSVVLTLMGGSSKTPIGQTIGFTLGFTVLMLTAGRWLINRALPWINRKFAWPGGVLSLALSVCFLAAAFTEYIGIHAIFGAFIIGVALGDSENFSERAKEIVHQFINNIFAPVFFVSIGLHVDVGSHFNPGMVIVFFLVAFLSKSAGAALGARLSGSNTVQSLAVGMGMNTHGTLEIILGTIALQAGLISEDIFVAILCTVVVTILIAAPTVKYCIDLERKSSRFGKIMHTIMREKRKE